MPFGFEGDSWHHRMSAAGAGILMTLEGYEAENITMRNMLQGRFQSLIDVHASLATRAIVRLARRRKLAAYDIGFASARCACYDRFGVDEAR